MRMRSNQLVLAMIFVSALTPALGQIAGSQTAAIDSALLAKASAGDAISQVLVGESYASGKGMARDDRAAAGWYRRAAEQGNAGAQVRLAALYRDGKGVSRDTTEAAAWYTKAAEQGDAGAQGTLGMLYTVGQGVLRSDAEAYYWLDLAARVQGPNQEKYAANRQMIGAHITADELAEVQEREAKWLAAHPR